MRIIFLSGTQHDCHCGGNYLCHIPAIESDLANLSQNCAIAISTDIYEKLEGVGNVGGIVGLYLLSYLYLKDY